ncbi:pancreatic lipase-related protein 2-like [Prorops nasuta]|uniref:pancreatic lipase-related protein 2-like n=1 Tax=Prorops nasuta TaxID=863751 RepID=UPI0034CD1A65
MKTKYLETGDYNVVCLNWFPGSLKEYSIAAELTRQVGNYLGSFLHFLASARNFSLDNVHVLGHSLGAHIAGSAGEKLQGKIGRITGMDPARPNFESPFLKSPMDRLDPSDAKFVDVIHTCAGTVGFIRPIGHVDFYPNGGTFKQPGCAILTTQYCSHGRSHEFMTWSIVNSTGFPSLPCDDWLRFKTKQCKSNLTVFMGEKVDTGSRGVFYLATNSNPPYGKGVIYDS